MGPTTGSIQGEETRPSGAKAAAAAQPPPPPEGPVLALPAGSADPAIYKTRRTKKTKEVGEEETTAEKKRKKRRTMREINAEIDGAGDDDDDGDGSSEAWSPLSPPSADCKFPMSRLWRLIRSEGASGTRTTPDAVFLINKASEMFLEKFVEGVHQSVVKDRKKSISYRHLSSTVSSRTRYEFLSDFVPEKVKAEVALKTRDIS